MNTNALNGHDVLDAYVGPAVRAARVLLDQLLKAASESVTARVDAWNDRASDWQASADQEAQRLQLRERRLRVEDEKAIADSMRPDQLTVRPLLLVVPVAGGSN